MKQRLALAVFILCIGGLLRIRGLAWGVPYLIDGDEFRIVNNGLNVYYTGAQVHDERAHLGGYPPFRSWEIASTRALGINNLLGTLILGRLMSLAYALITIACLFRFMSDWLPRSYGLGALFFALWSPAIWYGQTVLVDGTAMMFFTLTLWSGARAYRHHSAEWLVMSAVCGLLAGVAKYNMAVVLLVPLLISLRINQRALQQAFLPFMLISIPICLAFFGTVTLDDFRYDYLQPNEQRRAWDAQATTRQLEPTQAVIYEQLPRTNLERLTRNATFIGDWLPLPVILAAGIAVVWGGLTLNRLVITLGILGIISFLGVGILISTGARQQFGTMLIMIILAEWALMQINPKPLQQIIVGAAVIGLLWIGVKTWADWTWRTLPDSRAATVNWLIDHAPNEASVASVPILYEMGRLHGFESEKTFQIRSIDEQTLFNRNGACPPTDYLVLESPFMPQHLSDAVVARFAPPDYSGDPRLILDLSLSDCAED